MRTGGGADIYQEEEGHPWPPAARHPQQRRAEQASARSDCCPGRRSPQHPGCPRKNNQEQAGLICAKFMLAVLADLVGLIFVNH